jgi:putative ABC transport system permease protein
MNGDRFAAALIRCYPPALRREFGEEMRDLWRTRRLAASSPTARIRLWLMTADDLLRSWGRSTLFAAAVAFAHLRTPISLTEIRHAWKSVRRRPALSLSAALVLAVGLGFSLAAFSIVKALLLSPYPYPSLSRLVLVRDGRPADGAHQGRSLPAGDVLTLAQDARAFSGVTLWRVQSAVLGDAGGATPETFEGLAVTPNFFSVLQVAAEQGRTFTATDNETTTPADELIISDRLWRARFGGDRDAIGKTVLVNSRPMTLIGVIHDDACYPSGVDVWVPIGFSPRERVDHTIARYRAIARLKDDSSVDAAQSEADRVAQSLAETFPDTNRGRRFEVSELRAEQYEFTAAPFLLVQASAILVLGLAIINVVGLLSARAGERAREFAMRRALGASRAGLFVGAFLEATLLTAAAEALGLAAAGVIVAQVRQLLPEGIARWFAGWSAIGLDANVVAKGVVLAAIVALVLGSIVGWRAVRLAARTSLGASGRATVAAASRSQRAIVVAQVALAMALLACGAMILGGFQRIGRMFDASDPDHNVVFRIARPATATASALIDFHERLRERLQALPDVSDVGVIENHPASNVPSPTVSVLVDGRPVPRLNDRFRADLQTISPGAIRAVGLQVLDGRSLEETDRLPGLPVAVISASMASTLWPGRPAVGARIRLGDETAPWTTIVGVVTDLKVNWYDEEHRATIYVPFAQAPIADLYVMVHTAGNPIALAAAARQVVHDVDPVQPIGLPRILSGEVTDSITPIRALSFLLSIAALVSILLAAAGIYAAIAQTVLARRREFGLRLALGATARGLGWLTLGRALGLAGTGMLIGAPCAWIAGAALRHAFFDLLTPNVTVFVASAATLLAIAAAAASAPSLSATRTDPVTLLKSD